MNIENQVKPADLRDYLKSLGWRLSDIGRDRRIYVMENSSYPQRQLQIPMDATEWADAMEMTWRAIEKLADILQQSPEQLARRAQAVRDDTVRFRVFSPRIESGGIPLAFASSIVGGAQQLLKASACTVMQPRRHHPRLSLAQAGQLISKSTFGQTEQGSFVFRISCPVNAMDVQGSLSLGAAEHEIPFVRKVTLTMHEGLRAMVDAIETDSVDRLLVSIKSDASPLVSSNLCEAVCQMYDDVIDNHVDVSLDWSPIYPVGDSAALVRPVRIQSAYFSRIEDIRSELRAAEAEQTEKFVATVERLEGQMGDDGQRSGEVVLSLLLQDGESVRARTILDAQQYADAIEAHKQDGLFVSFSGRLSRAGRQPYSLNGISHFTLLRSDSSPAAS